MDIRCSILLVAMILICSCGNQKIEDGVLILQSRPIDFTACNDANCYIKGETAKYLGQESEYKLIVYIDSSYCSPCFISGMYEYEEIVNELDSAGIQTMFVFEPGQEDVEEVVFSIKQRAYPLQTIVVENEAFASANPHIPKLSALHSFLINKNNEVVVVGNPMRNAKIKELMLNAVKQP